MPARVELPAAQLLGVSVIAEQFHGVLEQVALLYRSEPSVRAFFQQAYGHVEEFLVSGPWYLPEAQICRYDGVLAPDGSFQIIEANNAAPAGVIRFGLTLREWIGRQYRPDEVPDALRNLQRMAYDPYLPVRAVLRCYEEQCQRQADFVALLHAEGRVRNEIPDLQAAFRMFGVEAGPSTPQTAASWMTHISTRTGESLLWPIQNIGRAVSSRPLTPRST